MPGRVEGKVAFITGAELAPHLIRVNTVHPGTVRTPMVDNPSLITALRPGLEHPTIDDAAEFLGHYHLLPVPLIESVDVANAVLFLVSDEARFRLCREMCSTSADRYRDAMAGASRAAASRPSTAER